MHADSGRKRQGVCCTADHKGEGEAHAFSLAMAENLLTSWPRLRLSGRGSMRNSVERVVAPLALFRNCCATLWSLVVEENAGKTTTRPLLYSACTQSGCTAAKEKRTH